MKKLIPLILVVVGITYLIMTCNGDSIETVARKHCHCGESLAAAAVQFDANNPASINKTMTAYNEMVGCLGGEEQWREMRQGTGVDYQNKLTKTLQSECPQVLTAFQKLGVYGF